MINWTNRNPIARMMLGADAYITAINPHGWNPRYIDKKGNFILPAVTMDIQSRINSAKNNGCQGVIIWDIEGYSLPIAYCGHPWLYLDPQGMASLIPWICNSILAAGMLPGFCLRETVPFQMPGTNWIQANMSYGDTSILMNKVQNAIRQWGIGLAYVDSNDTNIPGSTFCNVVTQAGGPILPIVEHWVPDYYGWAAAYVDWRNPQSQGVLPNWGPTTTAFCVIDEASVEDANAFTPTQILANRIAANAAYAAGHIKMLNL